MARFDFQSPGAAFTDQITTALAKRKADERQMLLDQLTVNAEGRAQEQAARQAEEHKAQLTATNQNTELQRLGAILPGLTRGTMPTNPEHTELLEKWGKLMDLPNAEVGTTTEFSAPEGMTMDPEGSVQTSAPVGPPPPRRRGYVGSPQEIERDRRRGESAQLVASLLQDPKTAEAGQMLGRLMQANDGVIPTDAVEKFTAPESPIAVWDEPRGAVTIGGKPVTSLPANAKVVNKGYAPYHAPKSWQYIGHDETSGEVGFVDPSTGSVKRFPGFSRKTGGSAGGSASALGLAPAYLDDIDLKEGALGYDPRSVDPAALEGYRGAMARGFSTAKLNASPRVRQLAIAYLSNPNAVADQIDQMEINGQWTKKDDDDFLTMIGAISPNAKNILMQNVHDPNKKKSGMFDWISNILPSGDK